MTEIERRKAELHARVQYHAEAVQEHVAALEAINDEIAELETAEAEQRKRKRWLHPVPDISLAALTGAATWVHEKVKEHRTATTAAGALAAAGGLATLPLLVPGNSATPMALGPAPTPPAPPAATITEPMPAPPPEPKASTERSSMRPIVVAVHRAPLPAPSTSRPAPPPSSPSQPPAQPTAPPADGPEIQPTTPPVVPPSAGNDHGRGNGKDRRERICLGVRLDRAPLVRVCLR